MKSKKSLYFLSWLFSCFSVILGMNSFAKAQDDRLEDTECDNWRREIGSSCKPKPSKPGPIAHSSVVSAIASTSIAISDCPEKPVPIVPDPLDIYSVYIDGVLNDRSIASDYRSGWENIPNGFQQYVSVKTYAGPNYDATKNGKSIAFRFKFGDIKDTNQKWLGAVLLTEKSCWGDKTNLSGNPVPCSPSYNLSRYKNLVFMIKGDSGQEVIVIAAHAQENKVCGDSANFPIEKKIILTGSWEKHEIPIRDEDLSRVITPFTVIAFPNGATPIVTVYIDDIRYTNDSSK